MSGTSVTAESAPVSPTLCHLWHSLRGTLLVGALVVLAAAVPLVFAEPTQSDAYLDPDSTTLEGGAALNALLRGRGVDVVHANDVGEIADLAEPGTRVLVSRPETLTRPEAQRVAALHAHVLVLGADHADVFLGRSRIQGAPTAVLQPGCALPAAARAGGAYLGGASFPPDAGKDGCYRIGRRPTLVAGSDYTLVASGDFMTNRRLDEDGNAALAMNLAGGDARLVWLGPPDRSADRVPPARGGRTVTDLMPHQVPWAVATLVVAVVLAAAWRARRLGPVVVEPLAVVVRAAETVAGRGRLYRARRARKQAASALRSAAVSRIVTRVGLPLTATPGQVVDALAGRFGQDADEVGHVLYGPAPGDDRALVRLADDLDALERTVRQR